VLVKIIVVQTGNGLGVAAKYLLDLGYSVTLEMEPNKRQRLEGALNLRVQGDALPEAVILTQGSSLIIGAETLTGQVLSLGVLPDDLCEPLERVADLIDG
jgi:hypothetical protein